MLSWEGEFGSLSTACELRKIERTLQSRRSETAQERKHPSLMPQDNPVSLMKDACQPYRAACLEGTGTALCPWTSLPARWRGLGRCFDSKPN